MDKDKEFKKWQEIWDNGLAKAQKTVNKNDDEYKVCSSPDIPLFNKDLIQDKRWLLVLEKALLAQYPSEAFEYWIEKGWLKHAIPEIVNLYGVPQVEKYHPEIDCGIHAMMVVDRSAANNFSLRTRYLALFHDFGKGITPQDILPSHHGHEKEGVPLVKNRLNFFELNEKLKKEIMKFTYYHGILHDIKVVRPKKIYDFIIEIGFEKDSSLAKDFCDGLVSDSEGRKGYFYKNNPNAYILEHIMQEWNEGKNSFEKTFDDFWLMKLENVKRRAGRDIVLSEGAKTNLKERFHKSFYAGIIEKVIASYYPDNLIKNKENVKRKV